MNFSPEIVAKIDRLISWKEWEDREPVWRKFRYLLCRIEEEFGAYEDGPTIGNFVFSDGGLLPIAFPGGHLLGRLYAWISLILEENEKRIGLINGFGYDLSVLNEWHPYTIVKRDHGQSMKGENIRVYDLDNQFFYVFDMGEKVNSIEDHQLKRPKFPGFEEPSAPLIFDWKNYLTDMKKTKYEAFTSMGASVLGPKFRLFLVDGYYQTIQDFDEKMLEFIAVTDQEIIDAIRNDKLNSRLNPRSGLTIESTRFRDLMKALGTVLDREYIDLGVLLLNRVIGLDTSNSKMNYVTKQTELINGKKQVVFRFPQHDALARLLSNVKTIIPQSLVSYGAFKEFESFQDPDNRPRKKRKKNNEEEESKQEDKPIVVDWFHIWKTHQLRLIVQSVSFQPWPIKDPPHEKRKDPWERYEPQTEINVFTGYSKNWDYCRQAYLSSHGRKCIDDFKRVVHEGFSGGNTVYSEYFHRWMAFTVQYPMKKTMVAVIIRTQMGVGKGFTCRILQRWWREFLYVLSGQSPGQKFNSFLQNKKMLWVDEVSSTVGDIGLLNSLITESTIQYEGKGKDQVNGTNLVEIIGGTNNEIRLPIGPDSRRWCLMEAPEMELDDLRIWKTDMFTVNDDMLSHKEHQDLGVWALLYHYSIMDITGFVPMLHLPKSEAILKCIEASLHLVHAWWKYILQRRQITTMLQPGDAIESLIFTWSELYQLFRRDENFEAVNQHRRTKLTQQAFVVEMLKVVKITPEPRNPTSFRFKSWNELNLVWKRKHPDIEIIPLDKTCVVSDTPFATAALDRIQSKKVLPALDGYTEVEKDYMLTLAYEKLRSLGVVTSFNGSIVNRCNNSSEITDVIEFK